MKLLEKIVITNHVMFRCFNEVQKAANQIFTDVTGCYCAIIREDEVIITIPVLTCNNIQTKHSKKLRVHKYHARVKPKQEVICLRPI